MPEIEKMKMAKPEKKVKPVKTAVVGCGMISNVYIKNLKNLFYIIDLVGICDLNQEAAKQKAEVYGIDRILSLEEVEKSEEIELVVNLTGPAAHYDVIKRMLLAGKHVYTEKMMTTDLKKGEELLRIATEKNLYLGVAPDTVLGAGIQTAKGILEKGLIGDVTSCHVSINRNQSLNSEIYRFLRKEGGTLPFDVGIYYIGALLSLLGPVESLTAFGTPAVEHQAELLYCNEYGDSWKIPGYNLVCGLLKFVSGVIGSLHFDGNTVNSEQSIITIYGTKGILKLGDPNTFDGYVKLCLPEADECNLPFTHGYNGKNTIEPSPFDFYGHRGIGVAEMAWAIRENRKNRCSKEYGFHCMEVLLGMEEAAAKGKIVYTNARFRMEPLTPGYYSTIAGGRGDAEMSLRKEL